MGILSYPVKKGGFRPRGDYVCSPFNKSYSTVARVTVDCILRFSGPVRLSPRYSTPDNHSRQAVRVRRWNNMNFHQCI